MEHIITGYTTLYGLLGYPIKHSKSPRMQNLAFAKTGVDGVYLTFDVTKDTLEDAVKAMRLLNVGGFQVTMPNKEAVLPLLDELSEEARLVGSLNVVKNTNGVLKGYNTDGMGFIMNLDQKGIAYKGKKMVQIGVGGAGRAVAIQTALSGAAELIIYDIDAEKACNVAEVINQNIPGCHASGHLMNEEDVIKEVQDADLLVDCTPLGMPPLDDKSSLSSFEKVPKNVVVVDICHTPPLTKFLAMAQANGNTTVNGVGMMYCQGAKAFNIWTGKEFPMEYVKEKMGLPE